MESSNILNRMASYDFKAPIDIVCYEEENSNDKIDLTSSPDSNDKEIVLNKETENNNICLEAQIKQKSPEKKVKTKKSNKRKLSSDNAKTLENQKQKQKKFSEKNSLSKDTPDRYENNQEYINDELKTLSKYLTLIMESYKHYLSVLNNSQSSYHDISLSKRSFLTTKYHFFNAGYKYVINFIMPNEMNQSLTQIFLNYVSNMASERLKIDCHLSIREIYFEMIQWVKLRQHKMLNDSRNTSIIRRHLNNPPIIPTARSLDTAMNVPQAYSSNADQNKLCIFSSGPIGNEISINIDKSLISNNNQPLNINNQPSGNSIVLNQNQQHNKLPVNGNFSFDNTNFSENRLPQHQLSLNPSRNVLDENNRVCQSAYLNYYHTTSNYSQSNNYVANNVMHRTAQIPPNVIHPNGNLTSYRREQLAQSTSRQDIRGPPPMYYSSIAENSNQMVLTTQVPTVQSDISGSPDLTRSSVSTDSGFISPVGSKSGSNAIEDIVNQLLDLENAVQPTKSTAEQITCRVCHTKSTLMCSACFKTNYCSTKCQRVDWEAHQFICHR